MTDEKEVKEVSEPKPADQTPEPSPEEMLKKAVEGEEQNPPEPEEGVKNEPDPSKEEKPEKEKKESDSVPRQRLNEVLEERKALREQLEVMQGQMRLMQAQFGKRGDEKNPEEEQIIKEMADEFFEGKVDNARKFYEMTRKLNSRDVDSRLNALQNQTAEVMTKLAVKEVIAKDPFAQKHEDDIVKKLMTVRDPQARLRKDIIDDAVRLVKGERYDEDIANAVKEAEAKAVKRTEEQKKIVSLKQETPAGSAPKKGEQLSDLERVTANKLGLSEEQYIAGKKKGK